MKEKKQNTYHTKLMLIMMMVLVMMMMMLSPARCEEPSNISSSAVTELLRDAVHEYSTVMTYLSRLLHAFESHRAAASITSTNDTTSFKLSTVRRVPYHVIAQPLPSNLTPSSLANVTYSSFAFTSSSFPPTQLSITDPSTVSLSISPVVPKHPRASSSTTPQETVRHLTIPFSSTSSPDTPIQTFLISPTSFGPIPSTFKGGPTEGVTKRAMLSGEEFSVSKEKDSMKMIHDGEERDETGSYKERTNMTHEERKYSAEGNEKVKLSKNTRMKMKEIIGNKYKEKAMGKKERKEKNYKYNKQKIRNVKRIKDESDEDQIREAEKGREKKGEETERDLIEETSLKQNQTEYIEERDTRRNLKEDENLTNKDYSEILNINENENNKETTEANLNEAVINDKDNKTIKLLIGNTFHRYKKANDKKKIFRHGKKRKMKKQKNMREEIEEKTNTNQPHEREDTEVRIDSHKTAKTRADMSEEKTEDGVKQDADEQKNQEKRRRRKKEFRHNQQGWNEGNRQQMKKKMIAQKYRQITKDIFPSLRRKKQKNRETYIQDEELRPLEPPPKQNTTTKKNENNNNDKYTPRTHPIQFAESHEFEVDRKTRRKRHLAMNTETTTQELHRLCNVDSPLCVQAYTTLSGIEQVTQGLTSDGVTREGIVELRGTVESLKEVVKKVEADNSFFATVDQQLFVSYLHRLDKMIVEAKREMELRLGSKEKPSLMVVVYVGGGLMAVVGVVSLALILVRVRQVQQEELFSKMYAEQLPIRNFHASGHTNLAMEEQEPQTCISQPGFQCAKNGGGEGVGGASSQQGHTNSQRRATMTLTSEFATYRVTSTSPQLHRGFTNTRC